MTIDKNPLTGEIKKRIISQSDLIFRGSSLSGLINQKLTQNKINVIGKIFNDISSKIKSINGLRMNTLHNNKISLFDWNSQLSFNEGLPSFYALASTSRRKKIVTFQLLRWGNKITPTVENIQNTLFHEKYGHLTLDLDDSNYNENKIRRLQINHSSWSRTTRDFKNLINEKIINTKKLSSCF